jgi:hypothetical protein
METKVGIIRSWPILLNKIKISINENTPVVGNDGVCNGHKHDEYVYDTYDIIQMEGDDVNKRDDCNGGNEDDDDKDHNAGQTLNVVTSFRKHRVALHILLLTYPIECFYRHCTLNLTTELHVLLNTTNIYLS